MITTINKTFNVTLAGDSIWGDTRGRTVRVDSIVVETFC